MTTSQHPTIRAHLLGNPDGLTAPDLADRTGLDESSIRRALASMADCYIDRWIGPNRGQYAAVWVAVPIPDNCPPPD
jgi:predicted DNA-binding transcriptional regulator YafY